ncbi:MAG: glycosyltransferase family 4 protein [Armatimonadetes bacterium]|nr:glycosyltransferase family 4 protein [Armatimonadota bacterium]
MSDSTGKGSLLILVQNLPLPHDRRVWQESLALRDAGYTVSVISPLPPNVNHEYELLEGIHLYRYPPPPVTLTKLDFFKEFYYCWQQTRRLVKRVWRERKFDAIQTCNPPDTFWLIAKMYKFRGVKFVFDQHDLCPEVYEAKYGKKGLLHKALLWLEKMTYRTADRVIATNESYRRVANQRGKAPLERIAIVRSGPSKAAFVPCAPKPELKRGFDFLGVYLGVMGPQDGVDYLIRAIKILVHDIGYKRAGFALIGKGDELENLKALSDELNLGEFVKFTGRISDEELIEYFSTADVGLAPDPPNPLNNVSTMNKIIEYMAIGLPIVSFDLQESRYSAQEAAVYVPGSDERKFAEAIRDLMEDEPKRREMSQFGRKRFEEVLSWEHNWPNLVRLYDDLLGHGSAQGK